MTTLLPFRSARFVLTAMAALATGGIAAPSQQQLSQRQSQSSEQTKSQRQPSALSLGYGSTFPDPDPNDFIDTRRSSLSASQVDDIVQQHPELVIELKSLVAEQLQQAQQQQQQGTTVLADSITDAQLYELIATSSSLRANITTWLRARGYVSQTDLNHSLAEEQEATSARPRLSDPAVDPLISDSFRQQSGEMEGEQSALLPALTANSSDPENLDRLRDEMPRSRSSLRQPKTDATVSVPHNVTDEPEVLRLPTPSNLLSLRDLYTQIPEDFDKLKRFGSETFINRDGIGASRNGLEHQETPIDLPIGPDYILGPGDGIVINIWGGISQSLNRTVDREGKVALPEAGSLMVAGLSLQRAQGVIEEALKQQFRNARVDVTIARLRTVRIYVVGDVQRPGAYDLSSLSTPLNALYSAGGPTSVGSLRTVRHYRGQQLVREVDLYDFLLHGLRVDDERLASGDTLLIPPAGPQAAVFGAVKRPAIYELKGSETLASLLEDAGGATVAAALNRITVDRIQQNHQRETVTLNQPSNSTSELTLKNIASFQVQDGDRVHVAPILPYSERAIYVQGHVARPGKYPYQDGMKLNDVLRNYQDLLPEPASGGELIRLVPPDMHAETIQFDVAETLIGNSNISLQPFDTIHIYGRYEVDSPHVTIQGEVLRPGSYALSREMTATQLVRMAGGFKRDALLESADLTSYTIRDGNKVESQRSAIAIGAAMQRKDRASDVSLRPGDILTIHQISGWADIGASVNVKGEVTFPGSYGLQEGEHLSSVLRRAGAFRGTAYPDGAILVRLQVKQLEDQSREELIRQIETTAVSARLSPGISGQDQTPLLQAAAQQQAEVLTRLRTQRASGRLVIHITGDIDSWANTPADIELRSGDVLTVPKRPGFVLVSGQVYNASAITFVPGKSAGWYLRHAGGTNDVANNREIFIVRADGSVVGKHSGGMFSSSVLSTRLDRGDVIVVPEKILGGSLLWRNLLTVAQITSSIAITAAVAGVL